MLIQPDKSKKYDVQELIKLFNSGLSTRQIAKCVNLSYGYVHKLLRNLGYSRDRTEAVILACPPKSKHWRSSRAAARKIWVRINGPIPKGYHIHHKDGDFTNNSIENLECISASDHAKLHHPKNPVPRHLRPERKEYMRKYYASKK